MRPLRALTRNRLAHTVPTNHPPCAHNAPTQCLNLFDEDDDDEDPLYDDDGDDVDG